MSTPTVADYLKYANLQMAAEAFLVDIDANGNVTVKDDIATALTEGNKHASRFTTQLADEFLDPDKGWTVVAQRPNTKTGFSGTLFRNNQTGELVISFRSTEFIDDAVRDNLATNEFEIKNTGFAWGQIADMEAWYAELSGVGGPLEGRRVNVTGYSLGGHLATAFNLLHGSAVVDQVVTFNGAGVGLVEQGTLAEAVAEFIALRADPLRIAAALGDTDVRAEYLRLRALPLATVAQVDAARAEVAALFPEGTVMNSDGATLWNALGEIRTQLIEGARIGTLHAGGDDPNERPTAVANGEVGALSLDYRMAMRLVAARTDSATLLGGGIRAYLGKQTPTAEQLARLAQGPLANQYDVVADTSPSAVANSQWHIGANVPVFIEDQPLYRGGIGAGVVGAAWDYGDIKLLVDGYSKRDFGDTHSLVLLVDSLSVQNVVLSLVPADQREAAAATLGAALRNASWRKREDGALLSGKEQGQAEGDVLENVVNALADLLLGPQAKGQRLTGSALGNTWAITGDTTAVAAD